MLTSPPDSFPIPAQNTNATTTNVRNIKKTIAKIRSDDPKDAVRHLQTMDQGIEKKIDTRNMGFYKKGFGTASVLKHGSMDDVLVYYPIWKNANNNIRVFLFRYAALSDVAVHTSFNRTNFPQHLDESNNNGIRIDDSVMSIPINDLKDEESAGGSTWESVKSSHFLFKKRSVDYDYGVNKMLMIYSLCHYCFHLIFML